MSVSSPQRAVKHSSLFASENDKDKERLYEELGIIGEISYNDDIMEQDVEQCFNEEYVLRTPTIKRPRHDAIIKCRTPEKPRRFWKFNHDQASNSAQKYFRCHYRKSPLRSQGETNISILSFPYEIVLHIFRFLDLRSLSKGSQVCRSWNSIASDPSLWRCLNFKKRTLSIVDLQNFLRNEAIAVSANSATIYNDQRNCSWNINNAYYHGNNMTPVYKSVCNEGSSPARDPFSRVYHYQVRHLDFTNADIRPTTLCLILTRCNNLANLSLENLTINHHVLGCISNCRTLSRLNLTLCKDVTVAGLTEVMLSCQNLIELNIAWSSVCKYPPDKILSNLPPGLTHLNIGGFRDTLQDGDIAVIISRCRKLQDLDISDSNHLTSHVVDMIVHGLSDSLRGINLSRCYSITPDSLLRFVNMPYLHFLDVFGVMDDVSVAALSDALPRVNVSLRPFSSIARPTPSMCLQKAAPPSTIWGHYVKI